ncbi:MrpF/PhaF family protein [Streptomyces sp. CA-132043]|uniref:MrpF/PhaF family protein n=1 Tax=Streptomyces sp. CA-132043 TaxID=3240048 RepID=UPI003D910B92
MNGWLAAAAALMALGVTPVLWYAATGPLRRRVAAQNTGTLLVCLVLLLLARGYDRPPYTDVALVVALLGPVGTLVYTRLLGSEMGDDPQQGPRTTVFAVAATLAVLLPLCLAEPPGRSLIKLLVIGALLVGGNLVSAKALAGARPKEADDRG